MNDLSSNLVVSDINIQVVRKNVKNINFSVRAMDGWVRVSVPRNISNCGLQKAIFSKIEWIRAKILATQSRRVSSVNTYLTGDKIYYLDHEYILEVAEHPGKPYIVEKPSGTLQMFVKENTSTIERESHLYEWYRAELKKQIPVLVEKWQPIIGKNVTFWGIKRMKTRWGTCNILKKRIWLNLELAKQSKACLEYVVVHEMTHLLERNHNARFKKLLDDFIPDWRDKELELNSTVKL